LDTVWGRFDSFLDEEETPQGGSVLAQLRVGLSKTGLVLFGAMRLIALRSPCCAQALGVHSMYARSTHASHPSLSLRAALRAFYVDAT
jgi:hypothetical protein